MKPVLLIIFYFCLLQSSCSKQVHHPEEADVQIACTASTDNDVCMNAVVMWGGDPAVDGAGWYLRNTEGKLFTPGNLPPQFKVHEKKVLVCMYETDELVSCLCTVPKKKYHITCITKR